jgi:hypothetical protein
MGDNQNFLRELDLCPKSDSMRLSSKTAKITELLTLGTRLGT